MTYRGDFDPSLFDQDDPTTWPGHGIDPEYRPGDWYYATAAGTINGHAVAVGGRVYPIGTGRRYGHLDYGDAVYGGPVPAPPWPADPAVILWTAAPWSDAPAWQRPPAPYDGEPFGDTDWRISVATYHPTPDARLYGDGTYGDGTYGDTVQVAQDWHDATCPVFAVVVRRGAVDAAPFLDVDQCTVELLDHDAALWPIQAGPDGAGPGGIVRGANVWTPIRVALIDPAGDPVPLFTGRIQDVADVADTLNRSVVVQAFGMVADVVAETDLARPEEPADVRVAKLIAAVGYQWGTDPAPTPAPTLRRIDPTRDQVRTRLDAAALSAGWQMRSDPAGVIGFHQWPTQPNGTPLRVTDRLNAAALPIVSANVIGDRGELLNVVTVESESVQGAPDLSVTATDAASTARFGYSSDALGAPYEGLSAQSADLAVLADAILARQANIVNRVTAIEVDSAQNVRWLAVLAHLDVGQSLDVALTKPIERSWPTIVVGYELRITPGRIRATVYLSTTAPTL